MKIRVIVAIALIAVVGVVIALAWNSGRESAAREEALSAACRAASSSPEEVSACLEKMAQSYEGPLDDYGRLANASAQHVQDYRAGR